MLQEPPQCRPDLTDTSRSATSSGTTNLPAWALAASKQIAVAHANVQTPFAPDELLTLSEVAQYLRVSPRTVSRMIKSGHLPAKRVGRGVRIERSQLMVMLADLPQISGEIGDCRE